MTETQQQHSAPEGPTPAGAEASEELAVARAERDQLQIQLGQQREQMLRVAAEMENIRKRAGRDVEQAHRFALEKFVQELLPAVDSLELATANAGKGDMASLAAGQQA